MFWYDRSLANIATQLTAVLKGQTQIMATIADLDTLIKGPLTTSINAAIAKIEALPTAVDTAPQIAELTALQATLIAANPPAAPAA
jgi:hypothetical protein